MMYGYGFNWVMMVLMMFFSLAFLAAIIILIVWAVNRGRLGGPAESPLNILKARYARGEITREEYERMKQELS
jgi:putative membrane protein